MNKTAGELIKLIIDIAEHGDVDQYSYFMNSLSTTELQTMKLLTDNLSTAISNQIYRNEDTFLH